MSTTMPSGSSRSARKQAPIVNVAPCSRCAGPKTAPRNECATMMWSETSTPNKVCPPRLMRCSRIVDHLAQYPALRRKDFGQSRRQILERDGRREQRIERRIGEQRERSLESTPRAPARAMRGRNAPDLARNEPQPAAVECPAQRNRNLAAAVPAELDDARLLAGCPKRGRKPGGRAARMEPDIATGRCRVRLCKPGPEPFRNLGARTVDVDQGHAGAGELAAKMTDQRTDDARPHDRDAIGGSRRRVPDR